MLFCIWYNIYLSVSVVRQLHGTGSQTLAALILFNPRSYPTKDPQLTCKTLQSFWKQASTTKCLSLNSGHWSMSCFMILWSWQGWGLGSWSNFTILINVYIYLLYLHIYFFQYNHKREQNTERNSSQHTNQKHPQQFHFFRNP